MRHSTGEASITLVNNIGINRPKPIDEVGDAAYAAVKVDGGWTPS